MRSFNPAVWIHRLLAARRTPPPAPAFALTAARPRPHLDDTTEVHPRVPASVYATATTHGDLIGRHRAEP